MKLSIKQVEKFLRDSGKGRISKILPIGQGEWSQAFFYQQNKIGKVIRFANIDEDFKRDQFAAANYSSVRLPIPKIEKIGQAFGGYYAISPKVEGEMIDNLNIDKVRQTLPALIKLFTALHATDTSHTIGYGPWDRFGNGTKQSWREYLLDVANDPPNSRTHGWKKKLDSDTKANKVFNRAYQTLGSLVPNCPETRHLIHSDLLHFNLLVNHGRISAVIDWGCAKYGDFLYDVAWFVFWQFYYPSMNGINFEKEILKAGIDIPHIKERLKCYQLHIGLDSMAYCAFKENQKDIKLIVDRLLEVISIT
jgi:hygromycin-B 4-O-kinase